MWVRWKSVTKGAVDVGAREECDRGCSRCGCQVSALLCPATVEDFVQGSIHEGNISLAEARDWQELEIFAKYVRTRGIQKRCNINKIHNSYGSFFPRNLKIQ